MCHNKRVFETLIREVGEWSAENFGAQLSKWPEHQRNQGLPYITLGHVAPLLGIIEEIGELEEAVMKDNPELIRDSIGDTQVYLADYLYRTGISADIIDWQEFSTQPGNTVFLSREKLMCLGQLAHINLKRHQRIRGYEGQKFFTELGITLTYLMVWLRLTFIQTHPKPPNPDEPLKTPYYTPQEGADAVIAIAASTWQHVKERNWKKDPMKGGT